MARRKNFWESFNEGWHAVDPAVNRLNDYWERQGLQEAYNNATTESRMQQGGEAPAAMMEGIDDQSQLGYDNTGGEARIKYGLGANPTQWQDKQFTDAEKERAGLGAIADYYKKQGKVDKFLDFRSRQRQDEAAGLQIKSAQNQLDEFDRLKRAREEFEKKVKDPYAYAQELFNKDLIGGQDMAGKKLQFARTNGGAMAWLVDENGDPAVDDKGSPLARHYTEDQVKDIALKGYLAQLGPDKLAAYEREIAKDKSDAEYKAGMVAIGKQNADTNEQYRRDWARLMAGKGSGGGASVAAAKEKVGLYTEALLRSGQFEDRAAAEKHAWGLVLRDPADIKAGGANDPKYREGLMALGPQPVPKQNWYGGVANQEEIDKWKANKKHLDSVFGVGYDSSRFAMPIRPMKAPGQ